MAYLVAVTACVSGVAHTYMAAERLEKLCLLEKWGVSIETQGALGTENRLADEDIRRADVALLITDIELAGAERFEHCRYVQCSIYAFLREPQRVMSAVRKVLSAPQQTHQDPDRPAIPIKFTTQLGDQDGMHRKMDGQRCRNGVRCRDRQRPRSRNGRGPGGRR